MSTTSVWVPLVGSASGIIGALAGMAITQWRAGARETRARQARWAREDELRSVEAKRDAYISFTESLGELERMIGDCVHLGFPRRPTAAQPANSALAPVYDSLGRARRGLDRMALFASFPVLERGRDAYEACRDWAGDARFFGQPDAEHNITGRAVYRDAERTLWDAMREDLGIATSDGAAPRSRAVATTLRARAEEDARGPAHAAEQEAALMTQRRRRAIAALDEQ